VRVNHVALEEDQEAPDMVIGLFLGNNISAVVFDSEASHSFVSTAYVGFDSEASHSFVSTAYVGKHNLPPVVLTCQMIVSSPEEICPQCSYAQR
jgi:hypothetical protein